MAMGELLAMFVRWSGLAMLIRNAVARRRVAILCYHAPPPGQFERHLEFLSSRYTLISLEQMLAVMRSGDWNALPPKSVVVTLDDGMCANHALLPLLRRYDVHPTIYVCSQLVGTSR